MSTSPSGLPRFADQHGPLIADMVDSGLRPDQIRHRFLLLHPDESPGVLDEFLNRISSRYSAEEATRFTASYSEVQIRSGVELAISEQQGLTGDWVAACMLDEPTFSSVERLTSICDPSGETTRVVLGRIAATRQAIDDGRKFSLSPDAYERVRHDIGSQSGLEDPPAWPVPWTEVAYRLGGGLWYCAMKSIGLEVGSSARGRRNCLDTMKSRSSPDAALEVQKLDDPGIGVITPAMSSADQVPESVWDHLRDLVAEDLEALPWKSQLVLKYHCPGRVTPPSAWAGNGPEGVTCAMSTTITVPAALWPLDEAYFAEGHWQEPATWSLPWTAGPLEPVTAAERMIDGLRFGRLCTNPYSFRWGTASIPQPSADDGADQQDTPGDVIPLRAQ
ncbi:hypothetical protein FCK90_05840 [Kocuria coralli]|uniref:Uncharacterized protein n=1 Tax=Kocuria coralli TaxID=1461025 RepID=A0A5J5KYE4_9MICC|nr:hypothetical protein [Kocuria coralli]KAA9394689.1 hypothetical protein FCK90_05840 [Kocuria coralli]